MSSWTRLVGELRLTPAMCFFGGAATDFQRVETIKKQQQCCSCYLHLICHADQDRTSIPISRGRICVPFVVIPAHFFMGWVVGFFQASVALIQLQPTEYPHMNRHVPHPNFAEAPELYGMILYQVFYIILYGGRDMTVCSHILYARVLYWSYLIR